MKKQTILLVLALLCFGCGPRPANNMPDVSVKPTDAFRLFAGLAAPAAVPDGVTDIQASGAIWMDFTVCCRFAAPRSVVDSIIATGYAPTTWESIASDMFPAQYIGNFAPKWEPIGQGKSEFFTKRIEQDHSTDILHLVVNRETGLVYAVGEGSVHP